MSSADWFIALSTIVLIILYGLRKSRGVMSLQGFLLADRELPWYHVGLSVMATQASAITFISAPGQAFSDGMRFLQFYFGLPLAMIVLCITFVPAFKKLNVYTAYEFLESRFDLKTRTFTAALFLLQRGLSTGITIYAPAIVLATILHVDLNYMIILNGLLVIIYTVYGGSKAVSHTQLLQMLVIFGGLFLAVWMIFRLLPQEVGVLDALHVAGIMGKMNTINTDFDWKEKYNIWSGIIGGFFLQLSYFGTDQSQVGRYLTGSSIRESRMGLLFNGLIKIPMQFVILLIGVFVFVFYQYYQPPVFFNKVALNEVYEAGKGAEMDALVLEANGIHQAKLEALHSLDMARASGIDNEELKWQMEVENQHQRLLGVQEAAAKLVGQVNLNAAESDSNYVFLSFVLDQFPMGMIGLLMAIIFLASMGSAASGLNSLASTSVVDFFKRFATNTWTDSKGVFLSRGLTVFWGLFCIVTALVASRLGNLIEAVNILGSLFYGTILGVFLVAFYFKKINGSEVFIAAVVSECIVIYLYTTDLMAFLWFNVIGCLSVILCSFLVKGLFYLRK